MNHAPAADAATRGRHAGLRLAFPLIALTVLVGGVGAFGYRSLSEEIRRETQRTLAVIAEQKRQHIEGWLAEARVDVRMVFTGHSQLEALFEAWLDGGRRDDAAFARMRALVEELARLRGWQGVALLDASESELARELDEQFGYEVVLPTGFTPWENAPDPGSLVATRREYRVDMPKRGLTVQGKRDKKTGEAVGSDA